MVYYRKYRPLSIKDLDSAAVRETLYAVLSGKTIPHAFLFTGPKGLGKTSTARIVAKMVNCAHIGEGDPDNTCDQCTTITRGSNIDVLEIDGASNRGIDEIRDLRERVNLSPSAAKKKIYIIDEIHMLTTEAFNALLKTIEEPPSHVIFIFCTTEPQKVPATIISRCFHVSFQLATSEEIVHSLQRIVAGENLSVEIQALEFIASLADGGFRDAAKILEEMVAKAGGKQITKTFIEEKYHLSNSTLFVSEMITLLSRKQLKESMLLIQDMVAKGMDIKYFISQILEQLHVILLKKVQGIKDKGVGTKELSLEQLQTLLVLLSDSYLQMKGAIIPQLPLEMAVILWCQKSEETITEQIKQVTGSDTLHQKTTIDSLLKKQQILKVNALLGKPVEMIQKIPQTSSETVQSEISATGDAVSKLYENIIYKIKPQNQPVAAVLRGSRIKEITDSAIIFEAAYKFHKERLEDKKTILIVEKAVKEITGKDLRVTVQLKK